ncbi:MAG: ABC transporter permease [Lawsonibacter sp.]|nr:ABC transporter permease [Lawsonibacter sp.]
MNMRIGSYKKTSQLGRNFSRLCQNKAAVVGMVILLVLLFCSIFAEVIAPYDYAAQNLAATFQSPSLSHLFGTDNLGRDIFSRVIYGARISLIVGLSSVCLAAFCGVILGAISGYYGNVCDNIIMRAMDILLAIPNLLLAISIAATLGNGIGNLILAIGIGSAPGYARIVRASILSLKDQEFVEATRSIGGNDFQIIFHHILPNCLAPIIVQMTLGVATAILSTASLSFIGLGIAPPTPEWGSMLSSGRQFIRDAWYVVTFPGLAIMVAIFGLNMFGDGLRDALDPKLKN